MLNDLQWDMRQDALMEREDIWGPGGDSEEYEQARWERDVLLRRRQFEVAMAGDPVMLCWLGMQYLGQTLDILPKKDEDLLKPLIDALDRSRTQGRR